MPKLKVGYKIKRDKIKIGNLMKIAVKMKVNIINPKT
jgi:hypothetical protein